jgi:hypothetical protein
MPLMVVLVVVVAVAGILVWPRPAKADPHAVFYTAIGQRQLFLNFLAALDQADYVEPAVGDLSREELDKKLKAADQIATVSETLDATKTDLAAVVSRLITLDGTDLWTNYLAYQIASGSAQKANTNAYIEELCARALGRYTHPADKTQQQAVKSLCDNHAPVGQAVVDRKRAFVVDPQERSGLAYRNALNGVYSSRSTDSDYQEYLKHLDDPKTKKSDIAPDFPVGWEESVAALNAKADTQTKKLAVDRLSAAAAGRYDSSIVNDGVFDLLEATPAGSVEIRNLNGVPDGADKIDIYIAALQGIVELPQQFADTAARGAAEAEQYLAATEANGGIAPIVSQSKVEANFGGRAYRLGRDTTLQAPAFANQEQLAAAFTALGSANAAPEGIPLQADIVQGTEPEVDRRGGVAGTQNDQRVGQVLHATTPSKPEDRFKDVGLDFDTNPAAVHEETGGKHLLSLVTDGSRDRDGCGCSMNPVLNDLGQAILGKINAWRL